MPRANAPEGTQSRRNGQDEADEDDEAAQKAEIRALEVRPLITLL